MNQSNHQPARGRSVWHGQDLEADRSFEFELGRSELTELGNALAVASSAGLGYADLTPGNFPLPRVRRMMSEVEGELREGRGFALLHGFPVDRYDVAELEMLYYGLCAQLGQPLTQNSDANLIHYVTDGALRPNQGTRGVGLPKESRLHVDLTDVVSLLCVRQAPDAPPSRVGSAGWIYNELLERAPDALERMTRGYHWSRMGEQLEWEAPYSEYRVPMFSMSGGGLSCRYNRNWIEQAKEGGASLLDDADRELFDLADQIGRESCFEFPFEKGDIQFCNNLTVLHGRAAHAPIEDESDKRLLLRIWLDLPDFRDTADPALIRYGIGRHGLIGFTPDEIDAGHHREPRPRRADGAIAL